MAKEYKCKYAKCLRSDKKVKAEDAVKVGSSYYHQDCHTQLTQIKEIIDLFQKYINPNPVYAQLRKVINTIVFDKNIGSDLLLFGVKYYIEKKIPLNYPQGLYYVIQNKEMKSAYHKWKAKKDEIKIEITEDSGVEFTHKPTKQKGLEDIFT